MPGKDGSGVCQNQNMVLTLLQAVIQQQRQLKQQLKLGSEPTTTSKSTSASQFTGNVATGASDVIDEPSGGVLVKNHPDDPLPGVLDNLLDLGGKGTESQEKVFNTSSDTVNNLLRGLSSTRESESIKKLSEETANVLPTFAKALGQSTQPKSPFASELSSPEEQHQENIEDNKVGASGTCTYIYICGIYKYCRLL